MQGSRYHMAARLHGTSINGGGFGAGGVVVRPGRRQTSVDADPAVRNRLGTIERHVALTLSRIARDEAAAAAAAAAAEEEEEEDDDEDEEEEEEKQEGAGAAKGPVTATHCAIRTVASSQASPVHGRAGPRSEDTQRTSPTRPMSAAGHALSPNEAGTSIFHPVETRRFKGDATPMSKIVARGRSWGLPGSWGREPGWLGGNSRWYGRQNMPTNPPQSMMSHPPPRPRGSRYGMAVPIRAAPAAHSTDFARLASLCVQSAYMHADRAGPLAMR
jgi:hypothetical protein